MKIFFYQWILCPVYEIIPIWSSWLYLFFKWIGILLKCIHFMFICMYSYNRIKNRNFAQYNYYLVRVFWGHEMYIYMQTIIINECNHVTNVILRIFSASITFFQQQQPAASSSSSYHCSCEVIETMNHKHSTCYKRAVY